MSAKKVVLSYVNEFKSFVKGDNVQVKAEQAYRLANAAMKVHISTLEGKEVSLEMDIEKCNTEYLKAKMNHGRTEMNNDEYINDLLACKIDISKAEKALSDNSKTLEFLRSERESFDVKITVDSED